MHNHGRNRGIVFPEEKRQTTSVEYRTWPNATRKKLEPTMITTNAFQILMKQTKKLIRCWAKKKQTKKSQY